MKVNIKMIQATLLFLSAFIILPIDLPAVTLATFNIRVSTKKDSINHWNYRKNNLVNFLLEENLDIVCFQEVSLSQFYFLKEQLKDYDYIGDEVKTVKGEEYVPVFFKKEAYKCKASGTFWLSETPEKSGSVGWDSANPRRATWILLEERASGKCIYILNTHLDHKGQRAKLEGMATIKSVTNGWSPKYPVVICGDMNCSSASQPYYIALNQEYLMYDAYQIAKKREGVTYSYHSFGKRLQEKRIIIDFIFVTPQVIVNRITIPKENPVNGTYLSDHNPVIIDLTL